MYFAGIFFLFNEQEGDQERAQYKKEVHAQVAILEEYGKHFEKTRYLQVVGSITFRDRLIDMEKENHEEAHKPQPVEVGKKNPGF